MAKISMVDLELHYRIGISKAERAWPQRLLVTIDMELDVADAIKSDNIRDTINYFDVAQILFKWGKNREWNLIEKLTDEMADLILKKFQPESVTIELKKFPLPESKYISLTLTKHRK
ncbi:MAG TPA: dihydroneopterin aldolase [Verrucomicrobiae bacterium]|nr:dihydroneopterin aldolase [Verrucomicrobiae bacterium]